MTAHELIESGQVPRTAGSHPSSEPAALRATGYWGLWRAAPKTLGILLLAMPFSIVAFAVLQTLFLVGLGSIVLVFGVFLVVGALLTARIFGDAWAGLIGTAVDRPITRPVPPPARPGGLLARLGGQLSHGAGWRALLHSGLLHMPLTVALWGIALMWTVVAVTGPTAWIWNRLIPSSGENIHLSTVIWDSVFGSSMPVDPLTGDAILYGVLGLIFLATLPLVLRGLAMVDWAVSRALLGETAGDRLQRDVVQLEIARELAATEEHRTLGQLERDLHDGPQQRLVRLQMDLAAAERRMADDPAAVSSLLAEARSTAGAALDELRALSRGVAPPLLADRGLRAALEAIADGAPIQTRMTWAVGEGVVLSEVTERTVYFIAAECLANAAKHSGAGRFDLHLADDAGWAILTASDEGRGGAMLLPGHGLYGLDQRVRGVGGSITLSSPDGGPTVIVARIPVSLGA
ncbi:sensor histidine kinase [Leucobacter iarius]|uniref:histidine kinase n=1 Tax=Leucobacter iarius TaxID=333963 RepID=A0ABP4XYD8_9MICO